MAKRTKKKRKNPLQKVVDAAPKGAEAYMFIVFYGIERGMDVSFKGSDYNLLGLLEAEADRVRQRLLQGRNTKVNRDTISP